MQGENLLNVGNFVIFLEITLASAAVSTKLASLYKFL